MTRRKSELSRKNKSGIHARKNRGEEKLYQKPVSDVNPRFLELVADCKTFDTMCEVRGLRRTIIAIVEDMHAMFESNQEIDEHVIRRLSDLYVDITMTAVAVSKCHIRDDIDTTFIDLLDKIIECSRGLIKSLSSRNRSGILSY